MKKQGLYITRGTTTDLTGCEFSYKRYVDRCDAYNTEEIEYQDDYFGLCAPTLKELKEKVSRK